MEQFVNQPFRESMDVILEQENPSGILLMTGKASYKHSKAKEYFSQIKEKYNVTSYNDFGHKPEYHDVQTALEKFAGYSPDLVIAVGGGSVIDFAKIFALYIENREVFHKPFDPDKSIHAVAPIVAIPTTAGSGSESTHFAVLFHEGQKYSIASPTILPRYPLVDPALSADMPPYLTACTGIDAICQGIESLWAVGATEESRKYARMSLEYLLPNITSAFENPALDNRKAMAVGAWYAGKAINISKTTGPHALSYYLTDKLGIPHGEAVAMNMEYFIDVNFDALQQVDQTFLLRAFNTDSKEGVIRSFRKLKQSLGLKQSVGEAGITSRDELNSYLNSTNPERMRNNPVTLNKSNLLASMLQVTGL